MRCDAARTIRRIWPGHRLMRIGHPDDALQVKRLQRRSAGSSSPTTPFERYVRRDRRALRRVAAAESSRGWTAVAVFADATAGSGSAAGRPPLGCAASRSMEVGCLRNLVASTRHRVVGLPGDRRRGDASVRRAQRAGRSESGDGLRSMSAARGSRGPRGELPRKRDACIATISVVSRV